MVEIEFKIAGELFRVNDEFSVVAHGDCNIGREGNGRGHDESVVVVGVFANQVDAAGGAEDSGVIAESCSKCRRSSPASIGVITHEYPCKMDPGDRGAVQLLNSERLNL